MVWMSVAVRAELQSGHVERSDNDISLGVIPPIAGAIERYSA